MLKFLKRKNYASTIEEWIALDWPLRFQHLRELSFSNLAAASRLFDDIYGAGCFDRAWGAETHVQLDSEYQRYQLLRNGILHRGGELNTGAKITASDDDIEIAFRDSKFFRDAILALSKWCYQWSRLLVSVLGNQNSGKTHTWKMLFGRNVRTGTTSRELEIASGQCVTVFLVSGSAEERRTTIETIMGSATPDIVLCSVQYLADAQNTFQFFLNRDYELVVHWLNPDYRDTEYQRDMLGLVEWLRHRRSLIGIRSARSNATSRVDELRYIIHGWAAQRGLVHPCS